MLMHPEIDPVAIEIGPLVIRWYGLMYVFGFLTAWGLGRYQAARPPYRNAGWTPLAVDDLITWCVAGLLLGARLGYVFFYDLEHFMQYPMDILKLGRGGMSFHGGLIGIAVAAWIFSAKHSFSFAAIGDFICPLAAPGIFAGRIGNFINGELWGRPTDAPWGMLFSDPRAGGVPRHPSQLYEAMLEGIVLFCIVWIFSRSQRPAGAVLGMFLFLYGAFRFAVEFFREPDPQLGFLAFDWLTMGQLLSLPMILLGAGLLFRAFMSRTRAGASDPSGVRN